MTGAATVILAMGAGKAAAKGIDEFLSANNIELKAYSMFYFIKKPPAGLNPSGGFLVICYVYIKAFSIIV